MKKNTSWVDNNDVMTDNQAPSNPQKPATTVRHTTNKRSTFMWVTLCTLVLLINMYATFHTAIIQSLYDNDIGSGANFLAYVVGGWLFIVGLPLLVAIGFWIFKKHYKLRAGLIAFFSVLLYLMLTLYSKTLLMIGISWFIILKS